MASLTLVINESRDKDEVGLLIALIRDSLKNGDSFTLSKGSGSRMKIKVTGKKADLKKLKTALKKKGETASIRE